MNHITPEQERKQLLESLVNDIKYIGVQSMTAMKASDHLTDQAGNECLLGGAIDNCLQTALSDPAEAGEMLYRFAMSTLAGYVEENETDLREMFNREEVA